MGLILYQNREEESVVDNGEVKLAERNEDEGRKRKVSHERVHALCLNLSDDIESEI